MDYEVFGRVVEPASGRGVPGVLVTAYDRDRFFDDRLGEVLSDPTGHFRLTYDEKRFKSLVDKEPDLYVTLSTTEGKVLLSTKGATRHNGSNREELNLELPAEVLAKAGLSTEQPLGTVSREDLTTLTCLTGKEDDDLVKQIRNDLQGKASLLEMFKEWAGEVRAGFDNNALAFRKMARLFELGTTPERLSGHHYGVAPGLRTGDLKGAAAEFGNLAGYLWGSVLGDAVPWAGKSFSPMTDDEVRDIAGDAIAKGVPVSRGINHFNVIETSALNVFANDLLSFVWHLQPVPTAEHLLHGHERNGGHFLAHRAPSVYAGTPREVLRLDYRHARLGNNWPLFFLIDEVVEIGKGFYLGQLLFATDHLFETYDPKAPTERYRYQHFGYFLIFDERWRAEAQRLYPHLEIPDAALGTRIVGGVPQPQPSRKLTTLTLGDLGNVNRAHLDELKRDLQQAGTLVHLFKSYSETLRQELDAKSPIFDKLHALFNAGIAPASMNGFYRGALISWDSQGLLALANVNSVHVAWELSRRFSPWTGKFFEPIDKARLAELTEGFETGDVPTFWSGNTVVFRTSRERVIRALARTVDVWMEDSTPEEKRKYGFDAKTFFFISKAAPSVNAANNGKTVFQFNYRWKALRNIIPDRYCIDEIVQVAEGMYLGQLFYSMDWHQPWDPKTPIEKYKYGLFAYFLLMDEEWHAKRLKIGFDPENV